MIDTKDIRVNLPPNVYLCPSNQPFNKCDDKLKWVVTVSIG